MTYWLTITQFARRESVARNTVLAWMDQRRVDWWEPAEGVRLIKAECRRPEPLKPWDRSKEKITDYNM
jgi:hypothetical protein